ncbi:MAG: hypothetical protein WEE64_08000 [Dehalococcoidia bacterium]
MRISKNRQMQAMMRRYRSETGEAEIDLHAVTAYAVKLGWQLPTPPDPFDLLVAQFSQAAREEVRHDSKTGRPYRANHALPYKRGVHGEQLYLWVDIDDAPRAPMLKSLVNRREQVVGDVVQLTFDAEHWNRINPAEEPIVMPADFTDDVEWRREGDKTA